MNSLALVRTVLIRLFVSTAILTVAGAFPPPAAPAGMVFLVAVDASGKVYSTYGNYSTADACLAALKVAPAPGKGLHLECRDLSGTSTAPPSATVLAAYALAALLGPMMGALGSAITLALIPQRGPLVHYQNLWRLTLGVGATLTGVLTVWIGRWMFSLLGSPATILMVVVMGVGFVVTAIRRLGRTAGPADMTDELVNDAAFVAGLIVGKVLFMG